MKIGFIGLGYVGGTTYEVVKDHFETVPYDKYKKGFENNLEKLSNCNIIFLAVPTPMQENGKIDLSIVNSALSDLQNLKFEENPTIVVRSTVVPGTTETLSKKYNFKFVFNPEFLREKHAIEDFYKSNRVILGSNDKENCEKITEVYSKFLPNAEYILTDFKTAETIKYASNTILATQIIMANELYKICDKLGVKYEDVKKILLLDERIAKNIDVPGPDGYFGFGGKCFPKDINAFIQMSKEYGYDPIFFEEVWKSNLRFREKCDWDDIKGATSKNGFD